MINGLQCLRAVAAIMVVLTHVHGQLERAGGPTFSWAQLGVHGVDLFFVISGFIIWTTSRSPRVTPQGFVVRRITRIVPLYWAMTTLIVAVALVAPSLLSSTKFDLFHVLASYAFIPVIHPVFPVAWPVLIPGWSLNYEMFFYVLFFVGLFLRNRAATFLFVAGALVFAVVFGRLIEPTQTAMAFYTDPIILEFALGMVAGALYTDAGKLPVKLAIAALLGAIVVVAAGPYFGWTPRVVFAGIPAAALVLAAAIFKQNGKDVAPGPIVTLGDASYSIYLSHVIVLPVITKIWMLANPEIGFVTGSAFVALQLSAAIVAGIVIYRYFELPSLNWVRGRLERPSETALARPS
jgi:exopolysaccharide production protein ExoZ